MTDPILPNDPNPDRSVKTNVALTVAKSVQEKVTESELQFSRDGYARVFNEVAPGTPNTPLRRLDECFNLIIGFPNSIGQGEVIDKKLEYIKKSQSEVMLTPAGKVLVDATLGAFDDFSSLTDQFRGGGPDSILHEGENEESDTVEFDGQTYKKYQKYWDYAPGRYGEDKAYNPDNGIPRNTEISNEFRIAVEKRKTELEEKIDNGRVTQSELKDYIASIYLISFATTARWNMRGTPINRTSDRHAFA